VCINLNVTSDELVRKATVNDSEPLDRLGELTTQQRRHLK